MSRHRDKKYDETVSSNTVPTAYVLLHDDVMQLLNDWKMSKEHCAMAQKIMNLVNAFLENDRGLVNAIKRQLAVESVHGCTGLQELGPKQSKGGAARIFILDKFCTAFFVAGGVEKGVSGIKIVEARARADEIKRIFKAESTERAIELLVDDKYWLMD